MKRYLLVVGLIALAFTSCGKKELEEQLITQQQLQDSIQHALNQRNAEVDDLFNQLNEIEESLDAITAKYVDVSKLKNSSGEITADKKAKIKNQIQDINEILNANKQKVDALNRKIKTVNKDNEGLKAFVTNLQTRIYEQEMQIQALSAELQQKKVDIENLNKDIVDLNKQNQTKDQHILQIEEEKNAAYVFIGTRKELIEKGVINRSGGFLGIGKKSLVSNDSDASKFTKIDIRRVDELALPGTKVKFVTPHPESSYRLNGDVKKPTGISISDPAQFWQKSRFLVIEVD
jgi:predicted  nucleic acid-binding Zn-ribbon protein